MSTTPSCFRDDCSINVSWVNVVNTVFEMFYILTGFLFVLSIIEIVVKFSAYNCRFVSFPVQLYHFWLMYWKVHKSSATNWLLYNYEVIFFVYGNMFALKSTGLILCNININIQVFKISINVVYPFPLF